MNAIEEIKSRIDIVDLVSETVKLRKTGKNYSGFCPFHPNSRTPAFIVFPDSGTWRCFGQCNEGGDIFRFVMKKEGWDFGETLRHLAERAGVTLETLTPQKQAEEEALDRLHTLLEEALIYYRYHLTQTPAGKTALAYLHKRGLTDATIETFGLGYAPSGWQNLLDSFTAKGYTANDLLKVGLISERQTGGYHDRFRNRITFPIRDALGRMTGFGARILDPDDVPKFLNSPQTALFDKGRLLYGLDAARKSIRAQDQVVIVEGYLDVIALHQAGFTNTVSPMGTALTEEQLRLLKRFTRRIVLALDADAAGEKATLRGLEIARQTLDRSEELSFDARGLLRHEARLQADLRVTTLPTGMDPDEVVLRDPKEWQDILAAARPIVIHVMETLAANRDLEDPKTKSDIVAQIQPLIEDVPDPVERDAYRQRLARLLRIDERALAQTSSSPTPGHRRPSPRPHPSRTPTHPPATPERLSRDLETHVLRLLLRQPEAIYRLDRALQRAGLQRFTPQELEIGPYQSLAQLIFAALEQEELETSAYFEQHTPDALQPLYQELLAPLPNGEPNQEKILSELVRSIETLRMLHVRESLQQLRFLQEELQTQEALDTLNLYQEMVLEYARMRERLDQALGQQIFE